MSDWLVPAHAFVTLAMLTTVLHMQFLHYPLFSGLDPKRFHEWHGFHTRRITWIVLPLMGFELIASFLMGDALLMALTLGIFAVTGLWSARMHTRLARDGLTAGTLRSLLWSNLVRLVAYVAKFGVLCTILF